MRHAYSSPPIHGALIARELLADAELFRLWEQDIGVMAARIKEVRSLVVAGLEQRGTSGTWGHITTQIGMFSYTGLTKDQCQKMVSEHNVFMLLNGRISLAGLNPGNVGKFCDAVHEVVTNAKM